MKVCSFGKYIIRKLKDSENHYYFKNELECYKVADGYTQKYHLECNNTDIFSPTTDDYPTLCKYIHMATIAILI